MCVYTCIYGYTIFLTSWEKYEPHDDYNNNITKRVSTMHFT